MSAYLYGYDKINVIYHTNSGQEYIQAHTFNGELIKDIMKYYNRGHINCNGENFNDYLKKIIKKCGDTDKICFYYIDGANGSLLGENQLIRINENILKKKLKEMKNANIITIGANGEHIGKQKGRKARGF
tara:strand:+ start:103 stop:492 length:390 start_codon:yes stop_codon:yes gene_type:complete